MTSAHIGAIFSAFGGYIQLARRLAVPPTTVHTWKRHAKIPSWRMAEIERVAAADGIVLPAVKSRRKPAPPGAEERAA